MTGASKPGVGGELVAGVAKRAFDWAGIDPAEVDVLECHDATSPAELIVLEELGLAKPGGAVDMIRKGDTSIGGRLPVNTSGGLESKGHPIGASGLAQIVELTEQLRGRCGERQVDGARIAVAENAGGYMGPDAAVADRDHPRRAVQMSGHRGSVALRLVNPVVRAASQSAFRRYHDDLDGMRAFFDRAGAAAGLLARPAPGCRIVDGELGGLTTREFHPARTKHGRTVLYLHGGGFLMYPRSALHRIPLAAGQ